MAEVAAMALSINQNADAPDGFSGTLALSAATQTATYNFTVPVTESSTADFVQIQAAEPLVAGTYDVTPPTDGSLSATNPFQLLLELGKALNLLEKQQETTPNRVQVSFNLDAGTGTLSLALPVEILDSPDGFKVVAVEFLA